MNARLILGLVGVAAIACASYGVFVTDSSPINVQNSAESSGSSAPEQDLTPKAVDAGPVSEERAQSSSTSANGPWGKGKWPEWVTNWDYGDGLTPEQRDVLVREFHDSKRALSPDERTRYMQSYDLQTMSSLAENGDTAALAILASYYLNPGPATTPDLFPVLDKAQPDKAFGFISEGIVQGKSRMASELARLAKTDFDLGLVHGETKDPFLDSYAALELASLQGDRYPMIVLGKVNLAGNGIELTAEQKAEISRRATKMYSHFEEIRIARGLGPFETEVSQTIKRKMDLQEALARQIAPYGSVDNADEYEPYVNLKDPRQDQAP